MIEYPRETTEEEFKRFIAECLRLQPLFGLSAWQLTFRRETIEAGDCLGLANYTVRGRCATISMTDIICTDIAEELFRSPEQCARHEMTHILTAKMEYLATNRFVTEEQVYDEVENIARVLEKFRLYVDE